MDSHLLLFFEWLESEGYSLCDEEINMDGELQFLRAKKTINILYEEFEKDTLRDDKLVDLDDPPLI